MIKLRTAMITLALVTSLMVGTAAADAKPGNSNGGGNSGGGKTTSSQAQKSDTGAKATNAGNKSQAVKESKESKVDNASKAQAKQSMKGAKLEAKKEAKNFQDTQKHWAEVPIQRLQLLGVISGFPDGGFHPEEPVTEEQVIAMVMGALGNEESTTEETSSEGTVEITVTDPAETTNTEEQTETSTPEATEGEDAELGDVPDWARDAVLKAKAKGVINRFHSHVQASRAQSMVMVAKAMGLEPADTSAVPFKDGLLISQEDLGYVMALYNEGIVKGGPGGMLNPNSSITRSQIAALLDRVITEEQEQEQNANTLQGVETVDGKQVLTVGTGENASEVTLAEDVVIFINGQRAEANELSTGGTVRIVTNEAGEAVLIEQTVTVVEEEETTEQTNEQTTDTTKDENTTETPDQSTNNEDTTTTN